MLDRAGFKLHRAFFASITALNIFMVLLKTGPFVLLGEVFEYFVKIISLSTIPQVVKCPTLSLQVKLVDQRLQLIYCQGHKT